MLTLFDGIFERVLKERTVKDLKNGDLAEFPSGLVIAILRFSKLLIENCTNRVAYPSTSVRRHFLWVTDFSAWFCSSNLAHSASFPSSSPSPSLQKLVLLLQLDSFEVVEASLSVALILMQRVKGPKSQKFNDLDQTLLVLSQNFGLKTPEEQVQLFNLPARDLPAHCSQFQFDYYLTEAETTPSKADGTDLPQASDSAEGVKEGSRHIQLDSVPTDRYCVTLKDLVVSSKIPERLWFSAFHRLRMAALVKDLPSRIALSKIRFMAAAALSK